MLLTKAVLGDIRWAALAGVLFAIHPANYLTTGWIACQNEQMMTAFILAGLLCYGRYSQWQMNVDSPLLLAATKRGAGYLIATIVCFIAALGCRENSILFPLFLVVGDFLARSPDGSSAEAVKGLAVTLGHQLSFRAQQLHKDLVVSVRLRKGLPIERKAQDVPRQ